MVRCFCNKINKKRRNYASNENFDHKGKNAFDKPLKFTGEERKYFFALPIKLIRTAFNIKD